MLYEAYNLAWTGIVLATISLIMSLIAIYRKKK